MRKFGVLGALGALGALGKLEILDFIRNVRNMGDLAFLCRPQDENFFWAVFYPEKKNLGLFSLSAGRIFFLGLFYTRKKKFWVFFCCPQDENFFWGCF